ncbi:protein of unknown function [Methylocella tundrae]|uniref:Uncharacterized protein n=1 Tax=Methylocella tundrae TaxID=227605 RepID=A0A4U8YXJ7_METTU|nr:protein of unknown function [Methylocella tundrae]
MAHLALSRVSAQIGGVEAGLGWECWGIPAPFCLTGRISALAPALIYCRDHPLFAVDWVRWGRRRHGRRRVGRDFSVERTHRGTWPVQLAGVIVHFDACQNFDIARHGRNALSNAIGPIFRLVTGPVLLQLRQCVVLVLHTALIGQLIVLTAAEAESLRFTAGLFDIELWHADRGGARDRGKQRT